MSALDSQPSSTNMLSPTGFRFVLKRAPNLVYFSKAVTLPSITMGEVETSSTFIRLPFPGDKLRFEPLTVRFQVDENMSNYLEVYNWLIGIGFPDNFAQFKNLAASGARANSQLGDAFSDGTLMILTSGMNPNVEVSFIDMFPISLSPVAFDSTMADITYIESDVTFAYRKFDVRLL